jgi:hypothetical protein
MNEEGRTRVAVSTAQYDANGAEKTKSDSRRGIGTGNCGIDS